MPIYLVRGDQLAVVSRTVPAGPTGGIATIDALLDGPTAVERAQGYRTAIPTHVGLDGYLRDPGRLVTVDVGPRFDGRSSAATRKARIAQLIYTATAISGVDRVRVRIDGATVASFAGIPLGGFVDRGVFLPRSSPTRPKYPPAPTSDFFKRVQLQLERTGYLPRGTANGLFGERTRQAVMAFQALEGLTVDGVVGTRTRARLPVAKRPVAPAGPVTGRRLEVDTARRPGPPPRGRERGRRTRDPRLGRDDRDAHADRHLRDLRADAGLLVGAVPGLAAEGVVLRPGALDPRRRARADRGRHARVGPGAVPGGRRRLRVRAAGHAGRHPLSAVPAALLPAPAADWALFLDIDGTLLDLAPTPGAVVVPPTLTADLVAAATALAGALAVLSGRPLVQIDALLDWPGRPAAGVHGGELRAADGAVATDTRAAAALASARPRLASLAGDGVLVEDKGLAVAVHVRAAPQRDDEVGAAVRELAAASAGLLDAMPGHAVWELRPATASKGTALRRLLAAPPFAGRRPVMVGDDVTDEEAMAAAESLGGLGVRVGAQRGVPPAAVRAWLADLPAALSRARRP